MVVFWGLVSVIGWAFIAYLLARKTQDGLNIGTFFALLFILNYPVKLIGTELGFAVMNSSSLGVGWQLRALLMANLAAVCFMIPIYWVARRRFKGGTGACATVSKSMQVAASMGWLAGFLVFFVLSYGVNYFFVVIQADDMSVVREMRDSARIGSGLSAIARDISVVCLMMYLRAVVGRWEEFRLGVRLVFFAGGGGISYLLLAVSGSKYMAMLPFVLFVLLLNLERIRSTGKGFSVQEAFVLGIASVIVLACIAYLRGFGEITSVYDWPIWIEAINQVANALDAPDNLAFILSRIRNFWAGDLALVPTFQYIFIAPIPRFIWPGKPEIYGNQYIMERYLWERFTGVTGEVVSPSMAGEMMVSGGVLFVVIWSFVLGAIFARSYACVRRRNAGCLAVLTYLWLTVNTFNVLRSGTGIIAPFLIFITVSWGVLLFAKAIRDMVWACAAPPLSSRASQDNP